MKRAIICGFFSIISSFWLYVFCSYVQDNPVNMYHTPPGLFITSMVATKMTILVCLSAAFLLFSLIVMIIEFIKK